MQDTALRLSYSTIVYPTTSEILVDPRARAGSLGTLRPHTRYLFDVRKRFSYYDAPVALRTTRLLSIVREEGLSALLDPAPGHAGG